MAKYKGWISSGGSGAGIAIDQQGMMVEFAQKPPESEFAPRPEGAPEGDFIETPNIRYREDERGNIVPIEGSQFAARLGQPGGQARQEFIGETQRRRIEQERIMATKLGARQGAKQQLDAQGMRMGYTPTQERRRAALRNTRAKLEQQFIEGQYLPEQMKQLEEQITLQENAIMPQMIRQPPTPQEQFQASIVTLPNGRKGQVDKNGMFQEIETGVSFKDYSQAMKDATELYDDPAQVQQYVSNIMASYQQAQGLITGADAGQQPQGVAPGVPGQRPQLRQPAPRQVDLKQVDTGLQELWKGGLVQLEDDHAGKAPLAAMEQFGQTFVAEAVASGMPEDQAIEKFMSLWKTERGKKGLFRDDVVPNFKKFDTGKLKEVAARKRLEELRAKARQG